MSNITRQLCALLWKSLSLSLHEEFTAISFTVHLCNLTLLYRLKAIAGSDGEVGVFLSGIRDDISSTSDFHHIWPRHMNPCPLKNFIDFLKFYVFFGRESFASKILKIALTSLQLRERTAERHCSLHVVVQGPGSFTSWPTFLYTVRF